MLEDRWSHREKWPPNLTTNAKRADKCGGCALSTNAANVHTFSLLAKSQNQRMAQFCVFPCSRKTDGWHNFAFCAKAAVNKWQRHSGRALSTIAARPFENECAKTQTEQLQAAARTADERGEPRRATEKQRKTAQTGDNRRNCGEPRATADSCRQLQTAAGTAAARGEPRRAY